MNQVGLQAAHLYQNTAKIATGGVSNAREDQVSFGSLMKAGLEKVVETQEKSERKKLQRKKERQTDRDR